MGDSHGANRRLAARFTQYVWGRTPKHRHHDSAVCTIHLGPHAQKQAPKQRGLLSVYTIHLWPQPKNRHVHRNSAVCTTHLGPHAQTQAPEQRGLHNTSGRGAARARPKTGTCTEFETPRAAQCTCSRTPKTARFAQHICQSTTPCPPRLKRSCTQAIVTVDRIKICISIPLDTTATIL